VPQIIMVLSGFSPAHKNSIKLSLDNILTSDINISYLCKINLLK